jgi:hypothetical protein
MGSGQRVPLETAAPPDPERSTRQARPAGQGLDRALSSGGEPFFVGHLFIFDTSFYQATRLRPPERTGTARPPATIPLPFQHPGALREDHGNRLNGPGKRIERYRKICRAQVVDARFSPVAQSDTLGGNPGVLLPPNKLLFTVST